MRPDLPWNVAGIPSEAREAARAAARREGLSVGEWLTRRIVRSFAGESESQEPMRETYAPLRSETTSAFRSAPDTLARADTDEMLARVSRSESQTQDIYNRIESHLGGLGRRLEATERFTAENNMAMSKAATEINLATREQAHAFDQLSSHMVSLSQRLERLEQSGDGDGTKDTIKTLHQGLSRLADQITQTAQQSATQIETLATSLEAVATKVGEVRASSESTAHTVEQRLAMLDERVRVAERVAQTGAEALERTLAKIEEGHNFGHDEFEALATNLQTVAAKIMEVRTSTEGAARTMDQRLAMLDERVRVVERVSHSSADALDKALEQMEARQQAHSDEAAEIHRRVGSVEYLNDGLDRLTSRFASTEAQTAAAIARIEDSVLRLDSRGSDPAIDRRLNSIERTLGDIVAKFEGASLGDEGLRKVHQRLDAIDQRHDDLLDGLHTAPVHAPAAAPQSVYAPEPLFEPKPAFAAQTAFAQQQSSFGHAAPPPEPVFDAPPFPEAPASKPDPFADSFAPILNAPPFASDATPASVFGEFAPQAAFRGQETTAPISEAPPPVTNESFLAAARRSARAAAATADTDKPNTFPGFNWGPAKVAPAAAPMSASTFSTPEADAADEEKPNYTRYLLIGIAVLIGLLAIAAIFLSQRAGVNQAAQHNGIGTLLSTQKPVAAASQNTMPAPESQTVPNTANQSTTPAPVATSPSAASDSFSAVPPKTKTPRATASIAPKKTTVETAPKAEAAAPKAAETPLDKLTKLATAGNAKAELLIGLKYIDADGVAANPVEGAKWLEKAAAKNEAVAAYRLGTLYERGKGVPADPTKATHWYQVAAQAGNRKAMHNLAVAYAQGTGTEKNFAEAARWFSKAAALGLSDSQFNLAVLYERGLGVPQSLLDAYKWYAIAASQGDTESKARIDALSTQISADDKAAAQRSADMFKPQAIDRRANMTPDANVVAH